MQGRPRGGKNNYHSKEEKIKIKKEMYIDFDINNYNTVYDFIDDIVYSNNNFIVKRGKNIICF